MSDIRQWSREFFVEFIDMYKNYPCLWQIKSKEYSDRERKKEAYAALVEKCKEVDKTATKDTVCKKINSFRSVYRKELLKVRKSIVYGVGTDQVYKPTLWYFELLSFLDDLETPRESTSNLDDDSGKEEEEKQGDESDLSELFSCSTTPATPEALSLNAAQTPHDGSSHSTRPRSSIRKRKQTYCDKSAVVGYLRVAGERLKTPKEDDCYDCFGKYVAHKLRHIERQQNVIAQKLINDVLFEAEMEALTKTHKVSNSADNNQPPN